MIEYIAKEGERLDQIVFKVQGNLNDFESVLQVNDHLFLQKEKHETLKGGEVIYIPEIKKEVITDKKINLWS